MDAALTNWRRELDSSIAQLVAQSEDATTLLGVKRGAKIVVEDSSDVDRLQSEIEQLQEDVSSKQEDITTIDKSIAKAYHFMAETNGHRFVSVMTQLLDLAANHDFAAGRENDAAGAAALKALQ